MPILQLICSPELSKDSLEVTPQLCGSQWIFIKHLLCAGDEINPNLSLGGNDTLVRVKKATSFFFFSSFFFLFFSF